MYPLSSPSYFESNSICSLSKKWRDKEQMDPIPYIEHSFLSIDRKILVKYRTLPFFKNSSYPRQLITSTPPYTTSWGGCSPFESNKVSSRGFIATFILKESEGCLKQIRALLPSLRPHHNNSSANPFLSHRAERTFGTSVGRA
jgi:hypothetical protein